MVIDKKNIENEATNKEKGATMVEYAMMVALVAAVCVVAVTNIGNAGNVAFTGIATKMNTANN